MLVKNFVSFPKTVPQILKQSNLAEKIKNQKRILIKPNLTTTKLSPCTTPAECIKEIIKFCQKHSQAEIIIAEGSGGCNTRDAFEKLGYQKLADKYKVELVDLNREKRIRVENSKALKLEKIKLPKIVFKSFLINVPVLKEHDEAVVTCAMKNLFGLYLNRVPLPWQWWNKSELHFFGVHQSIYDLNLYVKSNFILVDASIGQKGNEIIGPACQPPIKKIIAGYNIVKIDKFCSKLLGHKPEDIDYLKYADKNPP